MNATPLFNGTDARAARRMAEIIALGIELRQTPATAREIRQFADSATGLTTADISTDTRTRPECRDLYASEGEALGRIDPADAEAFAAHLFASGYKPDFLVVKPDGRIVLRSGGVAPVEAMELGLIVAEFVFARTLGAVDAGRIEVETIDNNCGRSYKPWVVLASGERIHAHCTCLTESDAQQVAERLLKCQRSTVAKVVEIVKSEAD